MTSATLTPLPGGAYAMGQELLRRINSIAAGYGWDLPARQVICAGGAALDCEAVTVMITGWSPMGNEVTIACQRLWGANLTVMIIRKAPALPTASGRKAPTVEATNRGGVLASNDADVMVDLANTLEFVAGELVLTVHPPEGEYQVVELTTVISRIGGLG